MFYRLKIDGAIDLLRLSKIPVYTDSPSLNGNGTKFVRAFEETLKDYYLNDDGLLKFSSYFGNSPEEISKANRCLTNMLEPDYIKPWYKKAYPYDPLGSLIDPALTFEDLYLRIYRQEDPYRILDVGPNLRNRVLAELCVRIGTPEQFRTHCA